MRIDLVVFDIAGTTVRDRDFVNDALRAALQAAKIEVTRAAVNEVMGLPKPEAIQRLIQGARKAGGSQPQVGAIHADFVARMQRFYASDPEIEPIPGTAETFAELRAAGIKVALDTGFSRDITQVILERLGWREGTVIDACTCSDEVARGRPHADMIHAIMQRLAIRDIRHVAKVGDTPADLHEGTNAGCGLVIGVTRGSHTREQLAVHPHTHLLETVADLPALLRSLGALPAK
jgi:phosphonatase-like hydrolase